MIAFQIFWFSVYWYGIFYALAFLLGYFGLSWIGQKKRFITFPKVQYFLTEGLENLILAIAFGVLIWGRLGHILIYGEGYYFQHLSEIVKVREGWMSFIGWIFGVVLAVALLLWIKKVTRKDFLLLFDMILIFVPLGIFFGRFGNFLNQELYGIVVSEIPLWLGNFFSSLGLVHQYSKVDDLLRINTNFLAMIFEWLLLFAFQGIVFLRMLKRKQIKIWLLASNFLLRYSIVRFLLEYLRADSQLEFTGMFTKSQRFFLFFIVISIWLKWILRKNHSLSIPIKK